MPNIAPLFPERETWSDLGIDIRGRTSGEVKTLCPKCSHNRKDRHKRELCLYANLDQELYNCHNCGWGGKLKGGETSPSRPMRHETVEKEYVRPLPIQKTIDKVDQWAKQVLRDRGISDEVIDDAGIMGVMEHMPGLERTVQTVAFPFFKHGEIINYKYLHPFIAEDGEPDKSCKQMRGAERIWYGLDWCNGAEQVIITEGEIDALSLRTVGYDAVLSVPDGAPATNTKEYSTKFSFFDGGSTIFNEAAIVIIATDTDGPGEVLANELARRIGKKKCFRADFPDDCKDANAVLMKYGEERLRRCITEANPWPVEGVISPKSLKRGVMLYQKGDAYQGVSTGFPSLDKIYRPALGQMTVFVGVPQHGKALSLDTPIPTPNGWTTMGDLRVGDTVFAQDGSPCSVTYATDVMYGRDCYRVEFADGSHIIADADHQWLTISENARRSAVRVAAHERSHPERMNDWRDQSDKRTYPSVVTTREIADTLIHRERFNHQIPGADPLQLPDADLPIEPYVLGIWLGDGSSDSGIVHTNDDEIVESLSMYRAIRHETVPFKVRTYGLTEKLRGLGVLRNKHIPESYLRGSEPQRRDLLAGLLDTDGHVTSYGRVEFCSTNDRLADGVFELAASLGFFPVKLTDRARLNGKDCGPRFRITFTPWGSVFRLSRKQQHVKDRPHPKLRKRRAIVAVDPVASVPVRCIQVDSPMHLYLAGRSMVPTHNTTVMDTLAKNLSHLHGWMHAFFSPENYPPELFMSHMLQRIYKKVIADISEEEIDKALVWLSRHMQIIAPEHPTLSEILDRTQQLVQRDGTNTLIIDPWTEVIEEGENTQKFIKNGLTRLGRLKRDHDMHIFVGTHPRKLNEERDFDGQVKTPKPSGYDIADSAHFINKADNALTIWRDVNKPGSPIEVSVIKSRFSERGRRGTMYLDYDPVTMTLSDGGLADER